MRLRITGSGAAAAEATEANFLVHSAPGFEVAARTDIGRRRGNNEDNFFVVPELGLFVLSDGMGGEAAGELASKIAVEEVSRHMREAARNSETPMMGEPNAQFAAVTNHLGTAVRRANRVIWEAAQHHASQRGMGATVVVASLHFPVLSIGHVGDSRIYMVRAGALQQLTQDHSLVAEQLRRGLITPDQAASSDMQNIIIRALGAEEDVKVDLDEVFLAPGDRLVLCSDGLTRMVPDEGIAQVVSEALSVQQACDRLVDIANENGGEDNVTVVVIAVKEMKGSGFWNWIKRLFSW